MEERRLRSDSERDLTAQLDRVQGDLDTAQKQRQSLENELEESQQELTRCKAQVLAYLLCLPSVAITPLPLLRHSSVPVCLCVTRSCARSLALLIFLSMRGAGYHPLSI